MEKGHIEFIIETIEEDSRLSVSNYQKLSNRNLIWKLTKQLLLRYSSKIEILLSSD